LTPIIRCMLINKYKKCLCEDMHNSLCKIQMLYRKYGEIPIYQYLTIVLADNSFVKFSESTINNCLYVNGLTEEYINSDDVALELYYITYGKKHNPINFV